MVDRLSEYLHFNFGIEIVNNGRIAKGFSALLMTHPTNFRKLLVINEDVPQDERIYFGIHSAVHILLGHVDAPFKTIPEPRKNESSDQMLPEDLSQHLQAKILTYGILNKRIKRYWDVIWDAVSEEKIPDGILVEDVKAEALELSTRI